MYIEFTSDKDQAFSIRKDEIIGVFKVQIAAPKIFVGSNIGLRNGQMLVVKEKYDEVMTSLQQGNIS